MQSYQEFRKEYKDKHLKFKVVDLNQAWKEYKKDEDFKLFNQDSASNVVSSVGRKEISGNKPGDTETTRSDTQMSSETATFSVEPQKKDIIAESQSNPAVTKSQEIALTKDTRGDIAPLDMYDHVADAVHQTAANFVKLITENKVIIEEKQIQRLNRCGAHLLKKYDKDGNILEYCPEIAYFLTLMDISTQVYITVKRNSKEQKKEEANTVTNIQPASTVINLPKAMGAI